MSLSQKTVVIFGGTGTFGKAFTRHLIENAMGLEKIVIFSRSELNQRDMMDEFAGSSTPIEYMLGDVRDARAVNIAALGADIIIHAAAMKHVLMAQQNPAECFSVNILGSQNVVDAAVRHKVPLVVALSTDKAVNPIGAYGASKLALELLFLDADRRFGAKQSRFTIVRFGNIFASKGSVVPLFLRLRDKGYLPVTDDTATRFSITLQDAIDMVLFAIEHSWGGEIITPVAPSYRVIDLAAAIDQQAEIRVIGLRPSEKAHEVIYSKHESTRAIQSGKLRLITPEDGRWNMSHYLKSTGATPVPGPYLDLCSSMNTDWLSVVQLKQMISKEAGRQPI